jgi:hypothetical protein
VGEERKERKEKKETSTSSVGERKEVRRPKEAEKNVLVLGWRNRGKEGEKTFLLAWTDGKKREHESASGPHPGRREKVSGEEINKYVQLT